MTSGNTDTAQITDGAQLVSTEQLDNANQPVSVKQFVSDILRQYGKAEEDVISYGYHTGWLEDQDVTGKNQGLDRRTAARIIHQFMRYELKEQENIDISPAAKLQDLYDCRSCVMHVAQVYGKGIMDGMLSPDGRLIFGMMEPVFLEESRSILECLFFPEKRKPKVAATEKTMEVEVITYKKAQDYLQSEKDVLLIDVRSLHEFMEKHLKNAMHIPLNDVLKNPYMVSMRRDRRMLLYCEEGYQSEIAAQCLLDAGYEKVCSFAWNSKDESFAEFEGLSFTD